MTLKYADRVLETSSTTGTGTINLNGPSSGARSFVNGVGSGSKVTYFIEDGDDWEAGIGTVTGGTPDTLSRDHILGSSNSNSLVNWGAGTRNVFLGASSYMVLWRDENKNFVEGFGAAGGTANAQTITLSPVPLAYSDGMLLTWYCVANITASATVNANGLGTKTMKWRGADLTNGAYSLGDLMVGRYNDTTGFVEMQTPPRNAFATAAQGAKADAAVPAIVSSVRNGKMTVTAASASATYTADEVVLQTAIGGFGFKKATYSQVINLASTGAGGMDTGTAPVSGYVSLYAIGKADGTVNILACAEATSNGEVYGGVNMPSGYTYSALIGVYPTNASSQFVIGRIMGRRVNIQNLNVLYNAGGGSAPTSLTSLALPVPIKANRAFGPVGPGDNNYSMVEIAASSNGIGGCTYGGYPAAIATLNGFMASASRWECDIITAQTIWWRAAISSNSVRIALTGYEF